MKFEMNILGDQQINRTLLRFSDRARDCRPLFDHMADYLAEKNQLNFEGEGKPSLGHKWTPLSPKYARWKQRHYPGRKILVLSGALRRDLTRRPFGIEQITAHGMRIGTSLPYADYHQHGRFGYEGRMPRRPPFELNQKTRREITKMLQKYLKDGTL